MNKLELAVGANNRAAAQLCGERACALSVRSQEFAPTRKHNATHKHTHTHTHIQHTSKNPFLCH